MKKTLPLIVLVLNLFLFSCKKDKEAAPSISIAGKWTLVSDITNFYDQDGKLAHVYDTITPYSDKFLTFKSDGTNIAESQNGLIVNATFTINVSDGKKIIKITMPDGDTVSGIKTLEYEIVTLTDHDLDLRIILNSEPQAGQYKMIRDKKLTR